MRFVYGILIFCVGLALAVSLDLSEWLRGGYGWRWPYIPVSFARILPLVVVAVGYTAGGIYLLRQTRQARWALLWAVVGTAALSVAVAYAREGDALFALFARTASGLTTGYHWAAARIDGGAWLDWTATMGEIGGHIGTSPPGLPALIALWNNAFDAMPPVAETLRDPLLALQCHNYDLLDYSAGQWASAWTGILMPLWAGFAALPIFAIARRVNPSADARWAALWWALVPGIAGFAASWSTFFPLVSAGGMLALMVATAQTTNPRTVAWAFGAGVIAGVGVFLNFALLPVFGLCGFYTLAVWWQGRDERGLLWPVMIGVAFGIGAVMIWALYWLIGGDTPFAILSASFAYHLDLDRPYWFWVFMHVWDFTLWTGAGLVLIAVFGLWRNRRRPSPLGLALFATLFVMTASGTTQGESGRIWLFLSPFVLIAAWDSLNRIASHRGSIAVTVGHAVLMVAITANLAVIGAEFTPRPAPPPLTVDHQPATATFSTATDGAVFRLEGFSAAHDGDGVRLWLAWRGLQRMDAVYWLGASLVAPDGTVYDGGLWQPREAAGRDARYPTTCWQPDALFEDVAYLPLNADAPSGDWWISLVAFGDTATAEGRLMVTLPDGASDVQVGIGPVRVGADVE